VHELLDSGGFVRRSPLPADDLAPSDGTSAFSQAEPYDPAMAARRGADLLRELSGELGPRALRRGRTSVGSRLRRLRGRSWHIGQCAVAASVAWLSARYLLGHPTPFFAPVAAIVSLGTSYGQRPRRVAEVTAGVALGVGIGDLFVGWVGTGWWQIAVVVSLAMSAAMLLDAGALIVTQAGVQSVVVTTLLPNPHAGFSRWLDAVVGGLVALVAATVVPQAPLRRPRQEAARVVGLLADLLREAARSAQDGDEDRAVATLTRARDEDASLDDLRAAAAEGLTIVQTSPFRRRGNVEVRRMADLVVPLDRALTNARVLVRRSVQLARSGVRLPPAYAALVEQLADAVDAMAAELRAGRMAVAARPRLIEVGRATVSVPRSTVLSVEVILAQVRSTVVDLLQATGLDPDEALGAVPPMP
jgi:uncharacterized membrane protein YgaE (UPF0421/DUF939 family)